MVEMDQPQRELLTRLSSDLQTGESRLFGQVESTFKWLMATLWASNGGALAACIGAEEFADRLGRLPFVLFALGLILSIVMGLVNLLYAYKLLTPMSELKNIFIVGATTGEFSDDEVPPLMERIQKSAIFKWPLWSSGLASLLLFIGGAIISAARIWP